jgi:signal transduction histidine kinase
VIKIDETIEIATRGHIPGGLIFRLTDPLVSPGGKGLLYHSANENLDGSLSKPGANWETQLQMGDRNWILTISATADYRKQHRPWMAWAVGVAGLVFAALLQILMLGMTGRTAVILRKNEEIQDLARNLEEKVAARTSELEESVQSYRNQVAERERAEEGLRQAKATLEQRVEERTKELILLHSRMVMQEKMASVGQLAAGIAHELNNPINFVRTNFASLTDSFTDLSVMLKAYQENMSRIRQDITQTAISDKLTRQAEELNIDYLLTDIPVLLTESETGFQRIATIINSMRDFSRIDKAEDFGWADINNGLEDTLVIARHEYRYHAEIVRKYGDLPEICCMLQQLNQVFLNIIVNCSQAVAAMPAGHKGCITISTRHEGNQIVCQIGDNGPGIPESIQQRIFEPFFTTKEPGKGTGLGLSISYDIVVNKHHGDLQVACPVTGGTVFSIILPIKQKE